jgi:hypothetical protein
VGEQQNQPFQLSFNPSLKVDFQEEVSAHRRPSGKLTGSRITSKKLSPFSGPTKSPFLRWLTLGRFLPNTPLLDSNQLFCG